MTANRDSTLPSASRPPPRGSDNLLLAALPVADYARMGRLLDIVPLKLKDLLHRPGEPIQYVYFPSGGFCSVLTVLDDGEMVEVATIGREGMIGVTAAFAGRPPSFISMVQGASETCYRMTAAAFRREMDRRGPFFELILHFEQALVECIMQSTACNAVHSIEQRLARWLLMAQDRMSRDEFPLTQDFVAMMLGASRPTVTVVAGALQKAGLITYRHGKVRVMDRKGLELASCECYRAVTDRLRAVADGSKSR